MSTIVVPKARFDDYKEMVKPDPMTRISHLVWRFPWLADAGGRGQAVLRDGWSGFNCEGDTAI